MNVPDLELPFGLRLKDLPFVDIKCGFQPSPISEVRESLRLSPALGVSLSRAATSAEKPQERIGKIAPEVLIPLLTLFESEGFFEMEERDVDDPKGAVRTITLKLPGREKQVVRTGMECRSLNRLTGAMKLTAGLSTADALEKNFLKLL